jgi:hypothetical protein
VMSLVALQAPVLGAEWTTFSNPEPPFTIQYPAEWTKLSADKGLGLLVLVAPRSRGLGLVVVGVPLKPGESEADLESELPRTIPKRFSDYQPLRTDRITLGGRPAIIHYFTGTRNGTRSYVMLAAVATKSHGYLLFGTAALDSPTLTEQLTLLQQIIMGFQPGR